MDVSKIDKPGTADETLELIKTVFTGPSIQALDRRVRVLFALAKNTTNGCIVELGTHHGYGSAALYFGSQSGMGVPVYTIDDYTKKQGWSGEKYSPDDMAICDENLKKIGAGPIRIIKTAEEAAYQFIEDTVGLLYVDTGMKGSTATAAQEWYTALRVGGIVAYRDTMGRNLGADKAVVVAINSGNFRSLASPDPYFLLIEKVK